MTRMSALCQLTSATLATGLLWARMWMLWMMLPAESTSSWRSRAIVGAYPPGRLARPTTPMDLSPAQEECPGSAGCLQPDASFGKPTNGSTEQGLPEK